MTPEINLLPKLTHKDEVKSYAPYVLIASIAMLVVAYFIYVYATAASSQTKLEAEEQNLAASLTEAQQTLTTLQAQNKGTLEEATSFVKANSYAVSPLMDEVTKQLPANTYLREYEFTDTTVTLTIELETMRDVSFYIERLVMSDYFIDAQISTVNTFELGNKKDDKDPKRKFDFLPRYTVTITAVIDYAYLKGGAS